MNEPHDLAVGGFSSWLRMTRSAQADGGAAHVPCGECRACCSSSYFVHIAPHETQTLARIPAELLFPAPDLPKGTVVMGYDEHGRCPMLRDQGCSIYEHRPLTCRSYDCRVYAAAKIAADRAAITEQARRWRFSHPASDDRDRHAAVAAAARFLQGHGECFPGGAAPDRPAQMALLAIRVHELFLETEGESAARTAATDLEIARAVAEIVEPGARVASGCPTDQERAGSRVRRPPEA